MPPPTLLLIDTSAATAQAATWSQSCLAQTRSASDRRNAQSILRLVQECTEKSGVVAADCTAIAVASGPGSFTGLRIGVGVAQGLAFAHDLPTLGISTLRLDAQVAWQRQFDKASTQGVSRHYLVAQKALEGEVYWAVFRSAGDAPLQLEGHERTVAIASATEALLPADFNSQEAVMVGSGWEPQLMEALGLKQHAAPVESMQTDEQRLQALASLALLDFGAGRARPASTLEPNYVKSEMGYRRVGE